MTRLFLFLLGLMLWCSDARADYPAVIQYAMYNNSGGDYTRYSTPQQACNCSMTTSTCSIPSGASVSSMTLTGDVPPHCIWNYKNGTTVKVSEQFWYYCPYGGTLNGTTCIGGSPPPPPCSDKNPFIRRFYYTTGGGYVAPDHYANCVITPMEMLVCRTDSTGTYCMWKVQRTGDTWNGTDAPGTGSTANDTPEVKTDPQTKSPPFDNPKADPKICPNCVPCPLGSVQAGVDSSGIPICMGTGTAPPDPPKPPPTTTGPTSTVTNADGSTTATQTTTQTNSDGSKTATTTTTTTGTDGTVTVVKNVTVTNTPSGSAGRTDSPATDQNNLCKQNPNLTICMNSTVSGTCGSIVCTGDAIQCATLRAAAAMQCKQQQDDADLRAAPASTLGSSVLGGSDPAASTLPSPSKASTVTMPGTLDQTGWLGGGQCFADKVVTVQGRTFVLPYSKACDYLIVLRLAAMVIASLVSFRIVRDAVLT